MLKYFLIFILSHHILMANVLYNDENDKKVGSHPGDKNVSILEKRYEKIIENVAHNTKISRLNNDKSTDIDKKAKNTNTNGKSGTEILIDTKTNKIENINNHETTDHLKPNIIKTIENVKLEFSKETFETRSSVRNTKTELMKENDVDIQLNISKDKYFENTRREDENLATENIANINENTKNTKLDSKYTIRSRKLIDKENLALKKIYNNKTIENFKLHVSQTLEELKIDDAYILSSEFEVNENTEAIEMDGFENDKSNSYAKIYDEKTREKIDNANSCQNMIGTDNDGGREHLIKEHKEDIDCMKHNENESDDKKPIDRVKMTDDSIIQSNILDYTNTKNDVEEGNDNNKIKRKKSKDHDTFTVNALKENARHRSKKKKTNSKKKNRKRSTTDEEFSAMELSFCDISQCRYERKQKKCRKPEFRCFNTIGGSKECLINKKENKCASEVINNSKNRNERSIEVHFPMPKP